VTVARTSIMVELKQPKPEEVASPCVNTCALDAVTGWCLGCGRSISEITGWGTRPASERRAIRAELPARMAALARAGRH